MLLLVAYKPHVEVLTTATTVLPKTSVALRAIEAANVAPGALAVVELVALVEVTLILVAKTAEAAKTTALVSATTTAPAAPAAAASRIRAVLYLVAWAGAVVAKALIVATVTLSVQEARNRQLYSVKVHWINLVVGLVVGLVVLGLVSAAVATIAGGPLLQVFQSLLFCRKGLHYLDLSLEVVLL